MKIRIFLILLTLLTWIDSSKGQGKIVMLNGKEKQFSKVEVKGEMVEYQPIGTSKPTVRKVDRYDVFSIVRDSTGEEIIYAPDTVAGEDPTISEVRDYIRGEQYAGLTYRKPLNLISGIAIGGASSLLGFYGLAVPAVYPAILGIHTPKVKPPIVHGYDPITGKLEPVGEEHPSLYPIIITEAFSAGYGKKARNMKMKNSLIGGGIGFAVGIAVFTLLLADE